MKPQLLRFLLLLPLAASAATRIELSGDRAIPALAFSAAEIERAAALAPSGAPLFVSLEIEPAAGFDPQAYRLERSAPDRVRVVGGGAPGAMYGGLDIAEAIRTGTLESLKNSDHKPYIARRGIKFNIPLDLRTPSYTDSSDAAQANIPEMWERDFWTRFLDAMARHRYNVLSHVHDCEALAWLGRYYAAKIRGACALSLFDVNGDTFEQAAALRHLGDALAHWKRYAAVRDAHYVPALYNRLGFVNITALTNNVAADLDLARSWKPGTLKDDGRRSGSEKGFRK